MFAFKESDWRPSPDNGNGDTEQRPSGPKLIAVHFYRADIHGVVVVDSDSMSMVAAAAGGNGFLTELREPTPAELEEYQARSEGP